MAGSRGRFHRQAAAVVAPPPDPVVEQDPVPEVDPTPEPVQVVESAPESAQVVDPTPEPVQVVESAPEPGVESEPDPEVAQIFAALTVEWDPTWTKARLLVVAEGKGLKLTSSNTKAEIVAALTAAG